MSLSKRRCQDSDENNFSTSGHQIDDNLYLDEMNYYLDRMNYFDHLELRNKVERKMVVLSIIIWPILLLGVSLWLNRTLPNDIPSALIKFTDLVLSIVPEAGFRPYYERVATDIYKTKIIMSLGWASFIPLLAIMIIHRKIMFFIPVKNTFLYFWGLRPSWLAYFLPLVIWLGLTYLFVFHGIYIGRVNHNPVYTEFSLPTQGFISSMYALIAAMSLRAVINTLALALFVKEKEAKL